MVEDHQLFAGTGFAGIDPRIGDLAAAAIADFAYEFIAVAVLGMQVVAAHAGMEHHVALLDFNKSTQQDGYFG